MKIIKTILFLIIITGFIILSSTCSDKKTFLSVTYEGHVYDKNHNPAPGVVVILLACSMGTSGDNAHTCTCNKFEVGRATTDASGHFYIKEKAARTDKYSVKLENGSLVQDHICEGRSGLTNYSSLYMTN